ncbi:hypothetical protein [Kribbella sp. NPDC055071]
MARATASADDPEVRAELAIGRALGLVAPGAITLADGRVRLPDSRDRLGRRIVHRFVKRLARRAEQQVTDERLTVEAVALLGAELHRSRGGVPVHGATEALDRLLDLPGVSDRMRSNAQALLRLVLEGDPRLAESGLARVLSAGSDVPRDAPPLIADSIASAQSIHRQAEALTTPVGPAPAAQEQTPAGFLAAFRAERRAAREQQAQLRYAEFRQQTAMPPLERLRRDIELQISGLEASAAADVERAEARTKSAATAQRDATESQRLAAEQEAGTDDSKDERADALRRWGEERLALSERHLTIAALATTAAERAGEAAASYRALLPELDRLQTTGEQPGPGLAAQTYRAQSAAETFRAAAAAAVPRKEVQNAAHSYGAFPYLSALCRDLNDELERNGGSRTSFRFSTDAMHRLLRGETHRLLAPDGLVLTVRGGAGDRSDGLMQFELKLDPGELREQLGHAIDFDEARSGQLLQTTFTVGSSASAGSSVNAGSRTGQLLDPLPESNPARVVSRFVDVNVSVQRGTSGTITGTGKESDQPGAVEALFGELLPYSSRSSKFGWRSRRSALAEWSPEHIVAAGEPHDAQTLTLAYSHSYTVPAPTDTVSLDTLGLAAERRSAMPEHVGLRVDGLNELRDAALAELQRRLGSLDRVGYNQLSGLITDEGLTRLDETSRPGGMYGLVAEGGRLVAYVVVESFPAPESAKLLSDTSRRHMVEMWRVGSSGTSGSYSMDTSGSLGASLGYAGSGLTNSSGASLGPSAQFSRSSGTDDTLTIDSMGSRWSTQRRGFTLAAGLPVRHRVTVQRLDRDESFAIESDGYATMRLVERDAFRYGMPVPADAVLRDEQGELRRGVDGRVLLRGDPVPTDEQVGLPIWLGSGPKQLRGAGPAMVRDVQDDDRDLIPFYRKLADEELIPPIDEATGWPSLHGLVGKDPVLVRSMLQNLARIGHALDDRRQATGYDHAAQISPSGQISSSSQGQPPGGGVLFELIRHRSGETPSVHIYRLTIDQHFEQSRLLGLTDADVIGNVDFAENAVNRSQGISRSVPWAAKLGLGIGPTSGHGGGTAQAGFKAGRTSQGESASSSTGDEEYEMWVSESQTRLAAFRIPHTQSIAEKTADGEFRLVSTQQGAATIYLDSRMCDRGKPPTMAVAGEVAPDLLATATIHLLDGRDPLGKVIAAAPELARGNSSVLQQIAGHLAVRNLSTRPSLLTSEHVDSLAVRPPEDPMALLVHRGLTPRRITVGVRARVSNLEYLDDTAAFIGQLMIPLVNASSTERTFAGASIGVSAGGGGTGADGTSAAGTVGLVRATSTSWSSTRAVADGPEQSVLRKGRHYQFRGDLALAVRLQEGGAKAQTFEVDGGGMVITIPEPDALAAYGGGRLNLPLSKVSDVVTRLRDGNLSLPRSTTVSLLRRYSWHQYEGGDERAASHTPDQLAAIARRVTGLEEVVDRRLQDVLTDADELVRQRSTVQLPSNYQTTMGLGGLDGPWRHGDGRILDLFAEVSTAITRQHPQLPDEDPDLSAALNGILAERRGWAHSHDFTDPLGFTRSFRAGPPGAQWNQCFRIRQEFFGPSTIDGGDPNEGLPEDAITLRQDWRLRTDANSATSTKEYDASLGGSGTADGGLDVGAGTEFATSSTAGSAGTGYHVTAGASLHNERVLRWFRVIIETWDEPLTPGKPPRRSPGPPTQATRHVVTGRMTALIPRAELNPPLPDGPGIVDHREARLPHLFIPASIVPHPEQQVSDHAVPVNEFHQAVVQQLGRRGFLTERGVRMHDQALRNLFGGSALITKMHELVSGGFTTPPLALPGSTREAVQASLFLKVTNARIVSNPITDNLVQAGESTRQTNSWSWGTESNRRVPTDYTVGGTDPTTGFSAGTTSSERMTEKDSSGTGARHEVGLLGSSQHVTVQVTATASVRTELLRRGKVVRSDQAHDLGSGTLTVSMALADYEAMMADMEAGKRVPSALGPVPAARKVRATELLDPAHPYQPLSDALVRSKAERVRIELTLRSEDGKAETYVVEDGTMTGPGNDRFGAAFATLHPDLPRLAEATGVDLREVFATVEPGERFSRAVATALQEQGIPASVIAAADSGTLHQIRQLATHQPSVEEAHRRSAASGGGVAIE